MKKILIIGVLLGVGYYALGNKKTEVPGTPIIQPGTDTADLPNLEGKALQVNGSYALFYLKDGKIWSFSSPESYNAVGSPEIIYLSQSELDALGGSVGGIDQKGNFFNF